MFQALCVPLVFCRLSGHSVSTVLRIKVLKSRRGVKKKKDKQGVRGQLYLGVTEGKGGRGGGGALHRHSGGRASSSIGQTICRSGSEGLVNIPPSPPSLWKWNHNKNHSAWHRYGSKPNGVAAYLSDVLAERLFWNKIIITGVFFRFYSVSQQRSVLSTVK